MTDRQERWKKLAAMLRAAANKFDIPEDAVVKVQKHGGPLVPVRLNDLLKRIERGIDPR